MKAQTLLVSGCQSVLLYVHPQEQLSAQGQDKKAAGLETGLSYPPVPPPVCLEEGDTAGAEALWLRRSCSNTLLKCFF